jgi:hypothetical protein
MQSKSAMPDRAERPPMLEIAVDKVCYLIIKAREFDVKEEADEDAGSNPADDGVREILLDLPEDPTYQELKGFLESLNRDEYVDLLALVWLGRGDYAADEWDEVVKEAHATVDKKAADYLLGIPLLGDFLEEGLNALGLSCEDMERKHL